MKKAIAIIFILLCATLAFAQTFAFQVGFSVMGVNAGLQLGVTDSVRIGANASVAMSGTKESENSFGWVLAQGLMAIDMLKSEANDFEIRFAFSYLDIRNPLAAEEPSMKLMGLTFGIQYTHWFGVNRNNGLFVGIDIPMGGYASGEEVDEGPFIGPWTSLATLGVLVTSFRTGYAFQF